MFDPLARIDFANLAGEMFVVLLLGSGIVILAKRISDERTAAVVDHFSAIGRPLMNLISSRFAILVLVLAVIVVVVFRLAKMGVL
jgi:uncharacterized membrane protein (DUF106 family)